VRLDPSVLERIDTVLGDLVERDPTKTAKMMSVPARWKRAGT
jgi:hypothetical protein